MQTPHSSTGQNEVFWASAAVRDDGDAHALDALASRISQRLSAAERRAIFAGASALADEAKRSFKQARSVGALLIAWAGSAALDTGAA